MKVTETIRKKVMPDYDKATGAVLDNPFPIDLEHRKQRRNAMNPPVEVERLFHFVNNKFEK